MKIRESQSSDLTRIVDIYNQAIRSGRATADTKEFTVSQKLDWFRSHQEPQYPLLVVTSEDEIVAWGSISAYRKGRPALSKVIEISYYVDYKNHEKGIGKALLINLISKAQKLGYEYAIALLLEVNVASVKLLEKQGFERIGMLPDVALLSDNLRCGHLIYGLNLKN